MRKCGECASWTRTVCKHVWNKYWNDKSANGQGCDAPMDGVAEAWRKAGWNANALNPPKTAQERVAASGGVVVLSVPSDASNGRLCAPCGVSKPKMPTRPKISAGMRRQAELFFRGLK